MPLELNYDERCQLSVLIIEMLQQWRMSEDEQLALLGMPAETRPRELTRLGRGAPFPEVSEQEQRARHLLGIDEALQVIFPHNRRMASFWVRHGNKKFPESPLTVMLSEGLAGMDRIWRHLDCTRNWE